MNQSETLIIPDRLVTFPEHWPLADRLENKAGLPVVAYTRHRFPDNETLFRITGDVKHSNVALIADLHDPDRHFLQLILLAETLHDLGAASIGLLAPYLPYMRQDKRFHRGESLSSRYFADLLSGHFDWLMTVDPHLHRYHALGDVYSIPNRVVHATLPIAAWISESISKPVLIGPDEESEQWVSRVAGLSACPYETLVKQRHGDQQVEVSLPHPESWKGRTPVLLDDIISSGQTMIAAVRHLRAAGMPPPICIAIHGVFAPKVLDELNQAGAAGVITTNTVPGSSALIDVSSVLLDAMLQSA